MPDGSVRNDISLDANVTSSLFTSSFISYSTFSLITGIAYAPLKLPSTASALTLSKSFFIIKPL